jgi:translocation and assembly module TamB
VRRVFAWLFRFLLFLLLLIIAVPLGAVIFLNSQAGRDFAVQQINQRSQGLVRVADLRGHFPADLKLGSLSLADKQGVWLTGSHLELRWRPRELLSRKLHLTQLSAGRLYLARLPVSAKQGKSSTSSAAFSLHGVIVTLDKLTVDELGLGAAVAGTPIELAVTGNAKLQSLSQGSVVLSARAADQRGSYQLAAALDQRDVSASLHIEEPPDGLIGHLAGDAVHQPLALKLSLAGPRDAGALNFSLALGSAMVNGAGTLDLDPAAPAADILLDIPSLAPVGQLAKLDLGGKAQLHLVTAQKDGAVTLDLDGAFGLSAAPPLAAKLLGPQPGFSLRARFAKGTAELQSLSASGAGFDANASGSLNDSSVALKAHLDLNQVADLLAGLSGHVSADAAATGRLDDLALQAIIGGTIRQKDVPSGPFTLMLHVAHLPNAPSGTLSGSGQVENAALALDAAFARHPDGSATVHIASASWRSIQAEADLALAAGAVLPTGRANFTIRRLADLSAFSPVPLAGSVRGDFSHSGPQEFGLHLTATRLNVAPALGSIDGTLSASGTLSNIAVRLNASLAKFMGGGLRLATAGRIDGDTRHVELSSLNAAWKTLTLSLLGPAAIDTQPDIIVHHLALGVNGGTVRLDGRLTPKLDLRLAVSNLPAQLAELASPQLNASGTLDASARLAGQLAAPTGKVEVGVHDLQLHSGPATALPPANLAADITLLPDAANVTATLNAGSDARLQAAGLVPLKKTGQTNLKLGGMINLVLLDPILAAQGSTIRGVLTPDFTITGTAVAPNVTGTLTLAGGGVQNIASGLNLTEVSAHARASGRLITLQDLAATAGHGTISGHGTIDLGQSGIPVDLAINADDATPVSSDLITETLDAALRLKGSLAAATTLSGNIDIRQANINIPKSLPPSVANLPIYRPGERPPPPPAPPPNVALDLLIRAHNQIFIRGDGLFAELRGRVKLGGTLADPVPSGGFTLIRGTFSLGGRTLQFTQGSASFNGIGFMPTLDLEATTVTSNNNTATLTIGGTAAKPTISLSSSPPLPSDEVLSQLLFGQSTQSLSPFQAASLATALASLSGIGGSAVSDPLGGVRHALGLDELSLGGGKSGGAPSLQAGRYVAPGVYVGARQATSGPGTEITVQINLYKGLKLQTQTGTGNSGTGNASSVGLTYQFNY